MAAVEFKREKEFKDERMLTNFGKGRMQVLSSFPGNELRSLRRRNKIISSYLLEDYLFLWLILNEDWLFGVIPGLPRSLFFDFLLLSILPNVPLEKSNSYNTSLNGRRSSICGEEDSKALQSLMLGSLYLLLSTQVTYRWTAASLIVKINMWNCNRQRILKVAVEILNFKAYFVVSWSSMICKIITSAILFIILIFFSI